MGTPDSLQRPKKHTKPGPLQEARKYKETQTPQNWPLLVVDPCHLLPPRVERLAWAAGMRGAAALLWLSRPP